MARLDWIVGPTLGKAYTTPVNDLLAGYIVAYNACRAALVAMRNTAPHMKDYCAGIGSGEYLARSKVAYSLAQAQYRARHNRIKFVLDELEIIIELIEPKLKKDA